MDLKTSLPQNAPADIVYSLPANFTRKGDKMDGHFCVTKEKIYVYNGSEITLEYSIDDFSEFECKQQIGTSMAQGTLKSGKSVSVSVKVRDLPDDIPSVNVTEDA